METKTWLLSFVILVLWLAQTSCMSFSPDKPLSIYDALRMNGLPIGLLPKNVKNYTVDEQGSFEVHLDKPCCTKFENPVNYGTVIKGNLSFAHIVGLTGIVTQELFLWFPIRGIHVDVPSSGLIYFDVGVVYKQFSLSQFETPRDCKSDFVLPESEMTEGKNISDMLVKTSSGRFQFEMDNTPTKAIQ